jgi:hypothetical protein
MGNVDGKGCKFCINTLKLRAGAGSSRRLVVSAGCWERAWEASVSMLGLEGPVRDLVSPGPLRSPSQGGSPLLPPGNLKLRG